jgi:signal peptidase I
MAAQHAEPARRGVERRPDASGPRPEPPAGATPAPLARSRASATRGLLEIPALLVIAGLAAFLVKTFVAQAFFIPSASMVPQLQINDRVVVSKLAYHLHTPHRGDIVVFQAPPSEQEPAKPDSRNPVVRFVVRIGRDVGVIPPSTEDFIKRVIALPGDTVEGKDGRVFVNGRYLYEPYLPPGTFTSSFGPVKVPPGQYWVMGDNREDSRDSRFFGPIKGTTIVGRTVFRVWPLWKAAFL